jgi:hypothetical protein
MKGFAEIFQDPNHRLYRILLILSHVFGNVKKIFFS